MKFQKIFLFVWLSLFCLASCQQGVDLGDDVALAQIPSTTSSVTAINIKQIMDKADYENVVKMDFYQDMVKESTRRTPSLAAVLNDPYKSGVDLDGQAYFIQDLDMSGEVPYNALVVNLKDKSAFETLVKSENPQVQTEEGFSYVEPQRGSIIAWNDQIAVMGAGGAKTDLSKKTTNIFNTTAETSVATNKDLQKCLNQNADISSWFGSDAIVEKEGQKLSGELIMAGFSKDMLKGNFAHSYFNFENGKINSTSEYTINPELSKEFGILFKDKSNTDFTKFIPSTNLLFATSGALSMEGVNEALTKRGGDFLINPKLKPFGLNTNDISKAFDGDFVAAGFRSPDSKDPNMLIGLKINDRTTFNKFLELGIEFEVINKVNDNLYEVSNRMLQRSVSGTSQIAIQDDLLFLSNDANIINQITAGGYSKADRISKKANNVLQDNILGGFINFEEMAKQNTDGDFNMENLENAIFRFDNDDGDFKIEMKDKDVNSLKQIFQWLNNQYQKEKGNNVI